MLGIFDFMQDMGNHTERKVDTYEEGDVYVDTCAISDSTKPYETAVAHPLYNDGKLLIVELYDTKKAAQVGHDKWVKIMTAEKLPNTIEDVSTANVVRFGESIGLDMTIISEKELS